MPRPRNRDLPQHLELNPKNKMYYYRHPSLPKKQPLGKDRKEAIQLARSLNRRFHIEAEIESMRLESTLDYGAERFEVSFSSFVEKYIVDYRLKTSTAQLLKQRCKRLTERLGSIQVPAIDTEMLREAIETFSQFEQTKVKTLLLKYFRFAKSTGTYPGYLPNPVDDLYIDPIPAKRRQRMTVAQFKAIYRFAPEWLQWCMVLAFHLALRRCDLVNLRFEDVCEDRIISPIRKTDTDARGLESTSVDFPIHDEVRRVIAAARESSLKHGRCPFIIHRKPQRITRNAREALASGALLHPAQVLPDFASKAFARARALAERASNCFEGLNKNEMPTLHEVRSLSSHLYTREGYDVGEVQDWVAHTDPDMTRHYQKGHARKVLRIDMLLPFGTMDADDVDKIREAKPEYLVDRQQTFAESLLTKISLA